MPKYSIVVPLHNEQENVTELYDRLKATMETTGEPFELVFVDDGSVDSTGDHARGAGARVIRHPYNKGNGAAVKTGIRAATG